MSAERAVPRRDSLVWALILGVVFVALGAAVSRGATMPIDDAIRRTVHAWSAPPVTEAAILTSFMGGIFAVSIYTVWMLIWFWRAGERRAAARILAVMLVALVVDLATKYGYARARPEPFFGANPETYSFPSGHALFSLALWVTVLRELPARYRVGPANVLAWTTVLMIVGFIGLSRVYLGVHYPSDVLGGYLAGGFAVAAASTALDRTRFARSS